MTTPDQKRADRPAGSLPRPAGQAPETAQSRIDRRRGRIRAEIQRNREGGHRVPTWVLATLLGMILLGWAYLIVTS